MEKKTITVGDVLRLADAGVWVELTHTEENTQHYITRDITEKAVSESLIKFYGWKKLDAWAVESIAPAAGDEDEQNLKITYHE